ncbi:MAG: hypothetical protein RIQ33_1216 [Bacteroidota bacterium]
MLSVFKILGLLLKEVLLCFFIYNKEIKKQLPNELNIKELKRITFFSLIVPALMSKSFALIQGKKITANQRQMLVLGCAATPIFDDFFDDPTLDLSRLKQIIFSADTPFKPQHFKEKLFLNFWIKLYQSVHNKSFFLEITNTLITVQTSGLKLINAHSNYAELKTICYDKGAASTLSYWLLIQNQNNNLFENEVVKQSGKLFQLLDDILDIWFDWQEKNYTIATQCVTIQQLKTDWETELNELKKLVHALSISNSAKREYLQIQFFLLSVGDVALQQLGKLDNANINFNPSNYSRKQLVCDMELWQNRWKWFQYFSNKKMY